MKEKFVKYQDLITIQEVDENTNGEKYKLDFISGSHDKNIKFWE